MVFEAPTASLEYAFLAGIVFGTRFRSVMLSKMSSQ
jgi:hypothetical protein